MDFIDGSSAWTTRGGREGAARRETYRFMLASMTFLMTTLMKRIAADHVVSDNIFKKGARTFQRPANR